MGKQKQVDQKDFKRLNKVVLKEGATNAMVSRADLPRITDVLI